MNVRGPLSAKGIEMYLLNLLFDGETQQRFVKLLFKYAGINREKCPSARQILRVNGVLISSLVFFILTWAIFYLLTFTMFLTVAYGANFLIENL